MPWREKKKFILLNAFVSIFRDPAHVTGQTAVLSRPLPLHEQVRTAVRISCEMPLCTTLIRAYPLKRRLTEGVLLRTEPRCVQAHARPLSGDAARREQPGQPRARPEPQQRGAALSTPQPRPRGHGALSSLLAATAGIAEPRRGAASLGVGLDASPRVACRSRSSRPAAVLRGGRPTSRTGSAGPGAAAGPRRRAPRPESSLREPRRRPGPPHPSFSSSSSRPAAGRGPAASPTLTSAAPLCLAPPSLSGGPPPRPRRASRESWGCRRRRRGGGDTRGEPVTSGVFLKVNNEPGGGGGRSRERGPGGSGVSAPGGAAAAAALLTPAPMPRPRCPPGRLPA